MLEARQVRKIDYTLDLSGRLTWFEGTASPLGDDTVLLVARDVTEQTVARAALDASEARHRHLVETASDIIYRTDAKGHFTFVNPAATRILGIPADGIVGTHFTSLIREDARATTAEFYARQAHERVLVTYLEFPAVTADGREVWIGQNVQLLTERGRVTGVQAVARDMTARYEVEREKNEFVSLVSHELRTPLTSIRGSLGLLASGQLGELPGRAQRMMEIAAQNTDRLVRLVNDILDLQRLDSNVSVLDVRSATVAELMAEAADAVRGVADVSGVRLLVEQCRGDVYVDRDRIVQVLVNLLGNAVKFSATGDTVWLEGELHADGLVLRVRDRGRGIPAAELERVFERFHQVDSSDARQHSGSGLGLAISRRIVEQHGGRIQVESLLGKGSTFSVTLPLEPGDMLAPVLTLTG